jgi:hypothetical protein
MEKSTKKVYSGFLWKRAIKSGRNWKRRFFVLYDDRIAYYTHAEATKPKGMTQRQGPRANSPTDMKCVESMHLTHPQSLHDLHSAHDRLQGLSNLRPTQTSRKARLARWVSEQVDCNHLLFITNSSDR